MCSRMITWNVVTGDLFQQSFISSIPVSNFPTILDIFFEAAR